MVKQAALSGRSWPLVSQAPSVLTDVEHEIEPAGEAVAGICYPHQQFALE
jgi:hypothetical protein